MRNGFTIVEPRQKASGLISEGKAAFTLIELLVVITIIVVLLALLAPALDKAVYQAELAVCGANEKAMGGSVVSYAMDHKRRYPYRDAAERNPITPWPASKLSGGNAVNDVRLVVRAYIPINKMLVDPLCTKVDLENDQAAGEQVFATYNLWFGWRIKDEQAMRRIGDRFTYTVTGDGSGPAVVNSFDILAADTDTFDYQNNWVQSSHPDDQMLLRPWLLKYKTESTDAVGVDLPGLALTLSMWARSGRAERGRVDNNVLFGDGSVSRYNGVASHSQTQPDDRMAAIAWIADRSTEATQLTHLPKD